MHKTVGMLAVVLAIIIALPNVSSAQDHPRKYGLEFQLGGGYYLMEDVNNFLPSDFFGYEPDKINIGSQFGFGIIYRHKDNFGWNIGYNKLATGVPVALEEKYEVRTYLPGAAYESWVEQTVSGGEFYLMATWYGHLGGLETMFGIGPSFYGATLDRSIDIVRDATGSHLTGGSFFDATGNCLGMIASLGLEFPIGENSGLSIQFGGRIADIGELKYDDPNAQSGELVVYKNASTGSPMGVDFTGGFAKLTLRTYFKPTDNWRSYPQK